jgi:sulfonate transport system permease protein
MLALQKRVQGVPLLLALILLWEVLPRLEVLDPVLLPPFDLVVARAGSLLATGQLPLHAAVSLLRVLAGFALASLIAIPLGIGLGLRPGLCERADLLLALLRPISPPAWIPLAILWFGIGDRPAVFIIFMGTVLAMLIGVLTATQGVDKRLVKAGFTLGATRSQAVSLIVLPGLLPAIFAQLRVGLGLAWMCVIAAEMVAVRQGLGYMMIQAHNLFQTDTVLVGMATVGVMGWLLDLGLRRVERRTLRWRQGLEIHELFDLERDI